MPLDLKSRKAIFVHGIFGWGDGELPFSYWGDALAQFATSRLQAHEVKCGPVSSLHDRACEVFAQIKGGDFVYGASPAGSGPDVKRASVPRSERNHVTGPLLPDWSADNPVILVGHSAGAPTCLLLQRLLAADFFGVGSNADWVEAVISVSGVMNGTTVLYEFGCDRATGLLTGHPERLIEKALGLADRVPHLPFAGVDFWLEQWKDQNAFLSGKDNLAYDLTLTGSYAANAAFSTHPNSYYLSLVTSMPDRHSKLLGLSLPRRFDDINPLLLETAAYMADIADFDPGVVPMPNWGTRPDLTIDAWRENDGAASAITQRFPFTHHAEPFGREGFFDGAPIEKGKWYFERVENIVGRHFDHIDPGFGATVMKRGEAAAAHRALYRKLAALLEPVRVPAT